MSELNVNFNYTISTDIKRISINHESMTITNNGPNSIVYKVDGDLTGYSDATGTTVASGASSEVTTDVEFISIVSDGSASVNIDKSEVVEPTSEYEELSSQLDKIASKPQYATELNNLMNNKERSFVLSTLGDSTANAENEWFYLYITELLSKYPEYTLKYRVWDDDIKSYSQDSYLGDKMLQEGADGEGYVEYDATSGDYISLTTRAGLDTVNDILDLRIKAKPTSWNNGGDQQLISRFGADGLRNWMFYISNNKLRLSLSEDGSAFTDIGSSTTFSFNVGDTKWLRVYADGTSDDNSGNYVVKFYSSDDGKVWAQLGSTINGGVPLSIATGLDKDIEIGTRGDGNTVGFEGKVYEAIGLTYSKVLFSYDAGMMYPSVVRSYQDTESNSITANGNISVGNGSPTALVLNGSIPGAAVSTIRDASRFDLMTANQPIFVIINLGHNESTKTNYENYYRALIEDLQLKYPYIGIVVFTQNPTKDPALYQVQHSMRNRELVRIAKYNEFGLIDTYAEFLKQDDYTVMIQTDGVHPNDLGSELQKNKALAYHGY